MQKKFRRIELQSIIIIGAAFVTACDGTGTGPDDIKPTPEECKLFDGFNEVLKDFGAGSTVSGTWVVAKRPDATSDEVVLSKACGPYKFNDGIAAETPITLRLEAGTEVRFGADGPGVILGGDATFIAEGTAAEPVVLTAADGKYWQGFTGFSKSVSLDHVDIKFAGRKKFTTDTPVGGSAMDITDDVPDGTYSLRNVRFSDCGDVCLGVGVFKSFSPSQTAKPFAAFENVSIDRAAFGIFLSENGLQALPEMPKITNVTSNILAIFEPLEVAATLPASDIPWSTYMDETHTNIGTTQYSIRIAESGSLTIPPGTTILNGPSTRHDIFGKLVAVGTEAQPIRFEGLAGDASAKGSWIGISVDLTGSLESDHLTILGAGANPNPGSQPTPCLGIEGATPRPLKGVNIVNCQGPAVKVSHNEAVFTENTRNSFTNCDIGYAVPPNVVGSIRASENTFKDVPKNHLLRGFTGSPAVLTTQTWDNLGIPWIADETFGFGPDVGVDGPGAPTLTLAAGVKLKFTDGGLSVGWGGAGGGGRIVAQGTAAAPIDIELSGAFIDSPIEIRTTNGSSFNYVNFLGDKQILVRDVTASFANCTFANGITLYSTVCGNVTLMNSPANFRNFGTNQPCP